MDLVGDPQRRDNRERYNNGSVGKSGYRASYKRGLRKNTAVIVKPVKPDAGQTVVRKRYQYSKQKRKQSKHEKKQSPGYKKNIAPSFSVQPFHGAASSG